MSERYTIERGDWGLFFYDQKKKIGLSFEDVGDILNGIEELISEIVEDLKKILKQEDFIEMEASTRYYFEKWEEKPK